MPAFYILYQKDLDAFFYEHATAVFEALNDKYADGTFPDKFTLRFDKPLTTAVLQRLHDDIL